MEAEPVDEYVRGIAYTNGMEFFWSVIKRGCDGVFHHMSEDHLHIYANEFAGRHDTHTIDTIDMMGVMAENMAGSTMSPSFPALTWRPARLGPPFRTS